MYHYALCKAWICMFVYRNGYPWWFIAVFNCVSIFDNYDVSQKFRRCRKTFVRFVLWIIKICSAECNTIELKARSDNRRCIWKHFKLDAYQLKRSVRMQFRSIESCLFIFLLSCPHFVCIYWKKQWRLLGYLEYLSTLCYLRVQLILNICLQY